MRKQVETLADVVLRELNPRAGLLAVIDRIDPVPVDQ
jgi:hypothetical protein